ncbi:MAG: T9SS type A sorting domain-containing protein [Ferruginibacter sp.]
MKKLLNTLILCIAMLCGLLTTVNAQFGGGTITSTVTLPAGTTYADDVRAHTSASGVNSVTIGPATLPFQVGEMVLIIQMANCTAGTKNWEFQTIKKVDATTLTFKQNLTNQGNFYSDGQVIQVPQYKNLVIPQDAILSCRKWNEVTGTGGVIPILASVSLSFTGNGKIDASGTGFETGIPGNGGTGGSGGLGGTVSAIDGQYNTLHSSAGGGQGIGGAGWGGFKGNNATGILTYTAPLVCCGCETPTARNNSDASLKRFLMGGAGMCGQGGIGGKGAGGSGLDAQICTTTPSSNAGQAGGNGGKGGNGGRGGGVIIIQARTVSLSADPGIEILAKGDNGSAAPAALTTGGATAGGNGGNANPHFGAGGGNGGDGGSGGDGGNGGAGGRLYILASNFNTLDFTNRLDLHGGAGGLKGTGAAKGLKGINALYDDPNCPQSSPPQGQCEFYCACDEVWVRLNGAFCTSFVNGVATYSNPTGGALGQGCTSVVTSTAGKLTVISTDVATGCKYYCDLTEVGGNTYNPVSCLENFCSPGINLPDPYYQKCQLLCNGHLFTNNCCGSPTPGIRIEPVDGDDGDDGNDGTPGDDGGFSGEQPPVCDINPTPPGNSFRWLSDYAVGICYPYIGIQLTTIPGGLNYIWDGPGVVNTGTNTIPLTQPGHYTVNVDGCTSSIDILNLNPDLNIISSATTILPGGSVTLDAEPNPGSIWTGPGVNSQPSPVTVAAAGHYCVTGAPNEFGCTTTACIDIIAVNACSGTPTPGNTVSVGGTSICHGTSIALGLQNVFADGGYFYQWQYSVNGGVSFVNIPGATEPTYTTPPLTVSTHFRCDVMCTTSASSATSNPIQISVLPIIIIDSIPMGITCHGTGDGSIGLAASGGTAPYTYLWDDGVAGANRTGLFADTYHFTVTDNAGCTVSDSITLTEPSVIIIIDSITPCSVAGANDGKISLTASGGIAPYLYSLDGNTYQVSNVFTGLAEGTYTPFVKDAHNCISTYELGLFAKPPVNVSDPNNPVVYVSDIMMDAINAWTEMPGVGLDTYLQNYPGLNPAAITAFWTDFNSGLNTTATCRCRPVRTDASISTTSASAKTGPFRINPHGSNIEALNGPAIYNSLSLANPNNIRYRSALTKPSQKSGSATARIMNVCIDSFNYSATCCPQTLRTKIVYDAKLTTTGSVTHSVRSAGGKAHADIQVNLSLKIGAGNTNIVRSAAKAIETSQTNSNNSNPNQLATAQVEYSEQKTMFANQLFTFNLSASSNLEVHGYGNNYDFASVVSSDYLVSFEIVQNNSVNCCLKQSADWAYAGFANAPKTTSQLQNVLSNFLSTHAPWASGTPPYAPVNINTPGSNGVVIGTVTCPPAVKITKVKKTCYNDPTNGCMTVDGYGGTPLPGTIFPCLGNHYNCRIISAPDCYGGPTGPFCTPKEFCGLCAGTYTVEISDYFGNTATQVITIGTAAALTINKTITNPVCDMGSLGTITINVSGGTGPYQYAINGGAYQSSNIFYNLGPGTYTLSVMDANGCITNSTATVTGDAVCDIYCDHYSIDNQPGWHSIKDNIPVNNLFTNPINVFGSTVNFNNIQGNRNDRIYHSIPTLPNSWVADFEFVPTGGANGGVAASLFCLSAGSAIPYRVTPTGAYTNQDFIGVTLLTPPNPANYLTETKIYATYKDGTAVPVNSSGIDIPAYFDTYYVRLERINGAWILLSVYSDANRTVHLPGSPVSFCIPSNLTINGLNTLQHSNINEAGSDRNFSGRLDNTCIHHGPNSTCPFNTDFTFNGANLTLGSIITATSNTPSANTGLTLVNQWIFYEVDANCNEIGDPIVTYYGNTLSASLSNLFLPGHSYTLKHGIYADCVPYCATKKCFYINASCPGNIVANGGLSEGFFGTTGDLDVYATINYWARQTWSPTVVNLPGCEGSVYMRMWGIPSNAESIQQVLPVPIQEGHTYRISYCARWVPTPANLAPPFVQFLFRASNIPLNDNEETEQPGVRSVIHKSQQLTNAGNWLTFQANNSWVANANYARVTISPTNNVTVDDGDYASWGEIDNICLVETPCNVVANAGADRAICFGSSTLLTATTGSGYTYEWRKVGDNTIIGTQSNLTVAPGASTCYALKVTAPGGCYRKDTVCVDVQFTSPGPIVTGPVNVCPYVGTGIPVTYTATSAGATGFTWVLPPNVTVVSGMGTGALTVTFQNGFTTQANKQLRVTALSSCGNSPQTIYYLAVQTPNTPQPIVASSSNVCAVIGTSGTITYTIPSVPGASSYNWSAQAGTTTITHPNGAGTANDTTVTVSFSAGFTNSNITVSATSPCLTSGTRSLAITKSVPATPGLINGPGNACPYMAPGGAIATYSVTPVTNASSYTWTVPAGAIGLTGQGTNTISFTYPASFVSGSVSVAATNGCGTSAARTLSITKLNPAAPGVIDVIQVSACGDRIYSYTLASMPSNATSVQWTIPAGAILISGQRTTSISVSYPPVPVTGNVTAQSFSNCSSSGIRTTAVKLAACPSASRSYARGSTAEKNTVEKTSLGALKVNVFPNPTTIDFNLQVLTNDQSTITVNILDVQGRALKNFTIQPYQAIKIGSELKAGVYMLEVRQGNILQTTRLLKL